MAEIDIGDNFSGDEIYYEALYRYVITSFPRKFNNELKLGTLKRLTNLGS